MKLDNNISLEIKSHKDLMIWKESMSLVVDVYHLSKSFPKEEQFRLTSQIRRRVFQYLQTLPKERVGKVVKSSVDFYT